MSSVPIPPELLALSLLALTACTTTPAGVSPPSDVRVAHLGRPGADPQGLRDLRSSLTFRNRGVDLSWHANLDGCRAASSTRVIFVQSGPGEAVLAGPDDLPITGSTLDVGAIVLLRPGQHLETAAPLSGLAVDIPVLLPDGLPSFVRPDWDPAITDTPGGCATEQGAYRRILLTWLPSRGPYVFHGLNAHRVRIEDSFTHYHPIEGGFDELYLVQMTRPGAQMLASTATERIENPSEVGPKEAETLFESYDLEVGDLLYVPRGVAHRGLGGALVQVIALPGFLPDAEIGVDHHLAAIAERLELDDETLPYNAEASLEVVVR